MSGIALSLVHRSMGLLSTKAASTITIYRAFSPQRYTATPAASSIVPYHIEERQHLCEKKDLYSEYDTECNLLKNDCGIEEDELHQNDVVYMGNGLSIQYVDKADGMNSSFLPWRLSR